MRDPAGSAVRFDGEPVVGKRLVHRRRFHLADQHLRVVRGIGDDDARGRRGRPGVQNVAVRGPDGGPAVGIRKRKRRRLRAVRWDRQGKSRGYGEIRSPFPY